jgi:hypothetical protein
MNLNVPRALHLDEESICKSVRAAVESGGETGGAAELLEAILLPHLAKERADVLEPLALLPRLARGEVTSEMAEMLPQIDQLKSDLRDLRVEHATILSALKRFIAAAREEGKSQQARFAERLLFRAWLAESVFTPLAILIGRYLELRLNHKVSSTSPGSTASRALSLALPEALQLSHAQFSAALKNLARAGGRTRSAANTITKLLEPHLQHEETKVLQILGLLAPLAAGQFDPAWLDDIAGWEELETNESALHLEHRKLVAAGEKLLAIGREEEAGDILDFAERLLLRIRLDEEVFYRAALFIRNYLRLRLGKDYIERTSSL